MPLTLCRFGEPKRTVSPEQTIRATAAFARGQLDLEKAGHISSINATSYTSARENLALDMDKVCAWEGYNIALGQGSRNLPSRR